uniref:Very-long-chain enoyl-CoA reductase n=1 Tax=Capra hircus TaxID=9925 RepID=A0A8C2RHZ4_CAPHI
MNLQPLPSGSPHLSGSLNEVFGEGRSSAWAEVEILDAKTREKLCFLDKVEPQATIAEIKNLFTKTHPQWYPARQSLRLDPKGKSLKDEDVLQKLPVGTTATLYFRDLGAQISWVTVFLTEYAGPLFIYLLFYFRVPFIYGHKYDFTSSRHTVVHLACICHSFHYIKRLLETLFVHRFSHGTMPLRNIFKNCTYYWGFAAWMAYYINHPLYTPPTYGAQQVKLALAIFVICQLGNFSIHMALRDLRPAGSKTRKIPYPTKNPFTWLFLLVSCPNYTYEVGSWIGFAIMTQCLPGSPHLGSARSGSRPTPHSWRKSGDHCSPGSGIKPACLAGLRLGRVSLGGLFRDQHTTGRRNLGRGAWRLLFLDWSTEWWAGSLQGHLGGHLAGPQAFGHVRLPLLPSLLPLEQPPLPLKLLHALHIAAGRAQGGVSGHNCPVVRELMGLGRWSPQVGKTRVPVV